LARELGLEQEIETLERRFPCAVLICSLIPTPVLILSFHDASFVVKLNHEI
jgi:hypothetical protein